MGDSNTTVPVSRDEEDSRALRARAEGELTERVLRTLGEVHQGDVARLVHELGVHRIELEMQNEELRRTHADLDVTRDRYMALYDEAPVAYLTTTIGGSILESNPLAHHLLGLNRTQLAGRPIIHYLAAGDRLVFQRACARLINLEGPQSLKVRLTPPRSGPVAVAMNIALSKSATGEPQLLAAMLDQSEQLLLFEDRARLAAIVEGSDDAIIGRDLDGRITSWNGGAERLFGVTSAQAVGNRLDFLLPARRSHDDLDILRSVRRGQNRLLEVEWRGASGRPVPLMVTISPTYDETGRATGSSLVGRDISERKRNELALHLRLRQLDVLAQAGHALIMAEPDATPMQQDLFDRVRLAVGAEIYLHYRTRDDGTCGLVAQTGLEDEITADLRQPLGERTFGGMDAWPRTPLIMEAVQDSPLPLAGVLRKAGVRAYAAFPLAAHGTVHGVAAFASTTRERFREGELQVMQTVCDQVAAMLERTELVAELHAREQALKAADRRKDDFIATLAHELRNPLAPIRNAVAILGRSKLASPQTTWCSEVIERQMTQLTRLLEDLLDVSRVTRNKIDLRRERLDVHAVVEAAVEASRPLIDAQRHNLAVTLPATPVFVYGDRARLTQVVGNLLNNAAKYTDAGGKIALDMQTTDDTVSISVRDNGIGIDPRQAAQVFDMFAQLEPALARSRGGLGIGLSLARGLIELHGGRIEAHSAGTGHGSEFVVHLPRLHPSAAGDEETPAGTGARPSIAGKRVLVVDDNADAAQTLATMLTLHGVDARVAFGGRQGLQMAEAWRPEAAVIDIGMPQINGFELCRQLRGQPWGESMLLIACTGWGQAEDRARARAAGFDRHLVKPVEADALVDALAGGRHP